MPSKKSNLDEEGIYRLIFPKEEELGTDRAALDFEYLIPGFDSHSETKADLADKNK